MPTKTTTKTTARKPVARKADTAAVSHKPTVSKSKVLKKKIQPHAKPSRAQAATPAKSPAPGEPAPKGAPRGAHEPQPAPAPRHSVESVSLIDEKKQKKPGDGQVKKKSTVLPPISRIRASLEATPTAPAVKPEPPQPETAVPS